jgi:sugar transferase EpsL
MRQIGLPRLLKRTVDILGSAGALALLSPVIGMTAVAVRASMGSPVVFRHQRPGLKGRPFEVFKFRTMNDARDADGELLPDESRLTKVGSVIRSLSLDELPQLWNVLRGDMSLVGPRPLLMRYLPLYDATQARRHDVLPGITGWAQINGRNAISWPEKFALDVWYADHWSPLLDLRILASTPLRVLRRSGIAKDGHVTMPVFLGNEAPS